MNLEGIYRPVRTELGLVEERLVELSRSRNESISRAVSEILGAGGKRLRPALLLIAARACGYCGDRSIRLAAAIELIHTASLIHDDVLDDASLRRGIPTINSRWGNKISVLVGDHLYSRVLDILADDGDLAVMRCVTATTSRMTDSEMTQDLRRNDVSVTEDQYLSIIAGKTAGLISCSCRIGAMLADGRDGEVGILSEYGMNLGMAFQITDDLLDFTSSKKAMGKPVGSDIREGKLTLPLIRALGLAERADREWMTGAFRSGQVDDDALDRMREMVSRYGGISYTLERANEYTRASKEALRPLQDSECRAALADLADYVVQRAS